MSLVTRLAALAYPGAADHWDDEFRRVRVSPVSPWTPSNRENFTDNDRNILAIRWSPPATRSTGSAGSVCTISAQLQVRKVSHRDLIASNKRRD